MCLMLCSRLVFALPPAQKKQKSCVPHGPYGLWLTASGEGGSGSKAPGLAARPDGSDRAHTYATVFTERTRTQQQSTAARHVLDEGSHQTIDRGVLSN